MFDRTVKGLLGVIALLLVVLIVKPSAVVAPAQAQVPAPAPARPERLMAVSNNAVYVLDGDQLAVYVLDMGIGNVEAMKKEIELKLLLKKPLPKK